MLRLTLNVLAGVVFIATRVDAVVVKNLTDGEFKMVTSVFKPIPPRFETNNNPLTPEKIALGKKLYHEKKLSLGGDLTCASCHGLDTFGVDNKQFSTGHKGQLGGRNAPTVLNAGLHVAQFWDGRAADLEEQALGPVLNPVEMAMPDAASVEKVLKTTSDYVASFQLAFPGEKDPVTFKNMGKAIAAFERTLTTPSRFDEFLAGDRQALNAIEQHGLRTFMNAGCVSCHSGVGVGGGTFQKLGAVKPFPTKDLGRFEVTKAEGDKHLFKVPSLRNIEKTGPYFHDGSIKTLDAAIMAMGKHQLGKDLSKEEVKSIATFLKALTGRVPKV